MNRAEGTPFTIVFQGDSITDAGRLRQSGDPGQELGFGYVNFVAAALTAPPSLRPFHLINRGVSGDRASDLYARWNEDALALAPQMLSVLVGVNDVWRWVNGEASGTFDRFERAYRGLLADTKEWLPSVKLVLCEPFSLRTGAPALDWPRWKSRLDTYRSVTRALAEEFSARWVPLQSVFDQAADKAPAATWLYDGVHPTPAGHKLIAEAWLEGSHLE